MEDAVFEERLTEAELQKWSLERKFIHSFIGDPKSKGVYFEFPDRKYLKNMKKGASF